MKLQLQTADSRLWQVEFRFRGRGSSRDVYLGNIQGLGDCVLKLQLERWESAMLATVAVASKPVFEGTLLKQYWHGRLAVDGIKSVGVLEEAVPLDCEEMLQAIAHSNLPAEGKLQAMKVLWAGVLKLLLVLAQRNVKIDDVGPRNLGVLASTPEACLERGVVEIRVLDWEALAENGLQLKLFNKALSELSSHSMLKSPGMQAVANKVVMEMSSWLQGRFAAAWNNDSLIRLAQSSLETILADFAIAWDLAAHGALQQQQQPVGPSAAASSSSSVAEVRPAPPLQPGWTSVAGAAPVARPPVIMWDKPWTCYKPQLLRPAVVAPQPAQPLPPSAPAAAPQPAQPLRPLAQPLPPSAAAPAPQPAQPWPPAAPALAPQLAQPLPPSPPAAAPQAPEPLPPSAPAAAPQPAQPLPPGARAAAPEPAQPLPPSPPAAAPQPAQPPPPSAAAAAPQPEQPLPPAAPAAAPQPAQPLPPSAPAAPPQPAQPLPPSAAAAAPQQPPFKAPPPPEPAAKRAAIGPQRLDPLPPLRPLVQAPRPSRPPPGLTSVAGGPAAQPPPAGPAGATAGPQPTSPLPQPLPSPLTSASPSAERSPPATTRGPQPASPDSLADFGTDPEPERPRSPSRTSVPAGPPRAPLTPHRPPSPTPQRPPSPAARSAATKRPVSPCTDGAWSPLTSEPGSPRSEPGSPLPGWTSMAALQPLVPVLSLTVQHARDDTAALLHQQRTSEWRGVELRGGRRISLRARLHSGALY